MFYVRFKESRSKFTKLRREVFFVTLEYFYEKVYHIKWETDE
jgi:hypothetical protein